MSPGVSAASFLVNQQISERVSKERKIGTQVWLRLVFRVACGSFLNSSRFESLEKELRFQGRRVSIGGIKTLYRGNMRRRGIKRGLRSLPKNERLCEGRIRMHLLPRTAARKSARPFFCLRPFEESRPVMRSRDPFLCSAAGGRTESSCMLNTNNNLIVAT